MIRLARAEFTKPVSLESGGHVTQLIRAAGHDVKADMVTRCVVLGPDLYPFEHVLRMRRAEPDAGELGQKCPECGSDKFDTASGLAAHRRHKHGVHGTWRKQPMAAQKDEEE